MKTGNGNARRLAALGVAALALAAGAKDLRYFNVVPIHDGDVEFAAREVKRQAALGMKAIAVELMYHPQCTPASALLPIHAANFRKLKALLADTGVEVGVLVQSTAGHGWSGTMEITKEPWQHSTYVDGRVDSRWCQLDPRFRAYVLEAVRSICREGPSFLLFDDDFGPKSGEGYCPLHVALYNRATGETRTADEWRALAKDHRRKDDPVRRKMEAARRQVPVDFAREIRAVVDSVDPKIRCGMCTPGGGMDFTRAVALALAGPDTKPFVRVCNATYGMRNTIDLIRQQQRVRQLEDMLAGIDELVAEADTCTQNYWSESARMFGTHLLLDVVYGLDGGKIWMSEYERPLDVRSQARYEKVFAEELPKRQALYDLIGGRKLKFHGVTTPVNWGDESSVKIGQQSLTEAVFAPFGFPCEVAKVSDADPHKVWALSRTAVNQLSDDEIRTVLSRPVFLDVRGARQLTTRGFGRLMGVEARSGDRDYFFNKEVPRDGQLPMALMWDESFFALKPVSDKVEVLSDLAYGDPLMKEDAVKGPGLTIFRNELGGTVAVAAWSFENKAWMPWMKYIAVARKEQLVKVMDRLAGGFMPFVAVENNHVLSSWTTLEDGSTLLVMTNLSTDDWRDLRVRLDKVPASARLLMDDGTWKPVAADRTGEKEVTFRVGRVSCIVPQILRLGF